MKILIWLFKFITLMSNFESKVGFYCKIVHYNDFIEIFVVIIKPIITVSRYF